MAFSTTENSSDSNMDAAPAHSNTDTPVFALDVTRCMVQCVGPSFLGFWQVQPGATVDVLTLPEVEGEEESEESSSKFDEENISFLRSLDPKDWKAQDHYAVLGLKELRHKATEDDIKKAYRLKVLRHHPDKRKAAGEEIRPDDDYFTCITKAWEVLGNPRCRRSYDSVDPRFSDEIPVANEYSKSHFFKVFGRAFELNSRWSEKNPVPKLGGVDATRHQVEKFYSFWYNFESWREYSYLDEEEKDKGMVREERKWIEKQNKTARAKLKKEEMTRIRSLVDLAYTLDPRIQKFKEEDKNRKLAAKLAKKEAARARAEEEERRAREAEEEIRKVKEQAEAEEKAKNAAAKAEREALKKALKREKAALRKLVKDNNYYVGDNDLIQHMSGLEKICESFQLNELVELVNNLTKDGYEAYCKAMDRADRHIEQERQALMDNTRQANGMCGPGRSKGGCAPWAAEQLQLLIKAVNIFPAGTNQRWEVVANFINQHNNNGITRTAKEVLAKAKDLQSSDYSKSFLKIAANRKAYDHFAKDHQNSVEVGAATSQRFDTPAAMQGITSSPWTSAEQQLLEQALKSYPSTTPERWDKIAECVPTRTKKDCMKRYKELVEMIKAKKAAAAAVTSVRTETGTVKSKS